MARFDSQIAIITGAAGDIGSTVARRLASDGASLVITDINVKKLELLKDDLRSAGAHVVSYPCDVTDFMAVQAMCDSAIESFGAIDLLFNNAGYQGQFTQVDKYSIEDFVKVIEINLVGVFFVLKAVSERMMMGNRGGSIVNTASMAGVAVPPNMPAYSTSKAGVIGLTRAASLDLAPHQIRVNAISPAFMGPGVMWDRQVKFQAGAASQYYSSDPKVVAMQMVEAVPMRRVGTMTEIANVVSFLLSDEASYLTGVNIPISGGVA
jgi:NAD(P)-dependent dehydrogenase (short-subunit alcohol dehydrogenase family)